MKDRFDSDGRAAPPVFDDLVAALSRPEMQALALRMVNPVNEAIQEVSRAAVDLKGVDVVRLAVVLLIGEANNPALKDRERIGVIRALLAAGITLHQLTPPAASEATAEHPEVLEWADLRNLSAPQLTATG